MTTKHTSHVGGLHKGDTVTFSASERSVTGLVTGLNLPAYQNDYGEVHILADGMPYTFGTGGHLGTTWTTESGSQEWFVDRLTPRR